MRHTGSGFHGHHSPGSSALWLTGILSAIFFLAGLVWFFFVVKDTLLQPGYFAELTWLHVKDEPDAPGNTGDKAAAGQFWGAIFGGLIGGGLTMLAAVIALGGALIQLRRESNKEFLEWVVDFNRSFHEDSDYGDVRVAFAERRLVFFKAMMLEEVAGEFGNVPADHPYLPDWHELWQECMERLDVHLPKETDPEAQLSPAFEKPGEGFRTNWKFVRKVTDLLRFYEMVLSVAQRLPNDGAQRQTFIGYFAWHIRSVLWMWPEEEASRCSRRLLVIYYLCLNRFENLAAIGYFFALQHRRGLQTQIGHGKEKSDSLRRAVEELDRHLSGIRAIYLDKNSVALPPDAKIMIHWKGVLGNAATNGF